MTLSTSPQVYSLGISWNFVLVFTVLVKQTMHIALHTLASTSSHSCGGCCQTIIDGTQLPLWDIAQPRLSTRTSWHADSLPRCVRVSDVAATHAHSVQVVSGFAFQSRRLDELWHLQAKGTGLLSCSCRFVNSLSTGFELLVFSSHTLHINCIDCFCSTSLPLSPSFLVNFWGPMSWAFLALNNTSVVGFFKFYFLHFLGILVDNRV